MDEHSNTPATRAQLDAWVLSTWRQAVAFAASLLRDRTLAEDVVHDCYCNLLRKAAVYDLPRDGVKLLLKSVANAAIKRNTRDRLTVSLDVCPSDDRSAPHPANPGGGPVQMALERELDGAIRQALARLPVPQRAALELKGLGHSLQEIAQALETTTSNAGVLIHRAREAMARHLSAYLEGHVG